MNPTHLVVACNALLQAMDAANHAEKQFFDKYHHIIVEWDTWGREGTRWFPENMFSKAGVRSVHGSRFAVRTRPDTITKDWMHNPSFEQIDDAVDDYLTVLDFNPRPIVKGDPTPEDSEEWIYFTTDQATKRTIVSVDRRDVEIETALPFRAMVSRKPWRD